ncbi:hypothetical protein BCR39DRAFT_26993 [Naematelia encephala]|uniref:Uncharacterized protein n=1 Tax=Naematelia encephala TaxID=71784 RepID=A0A1Y2BLX9_9TREE|nr:hypothetical protein BCR39DRAFT_26993 [Naematelia encephala]
MEAMCSPSAYLLDPTSHLDEEPSSFLSFSSFSDISSVSFDYLRSSFDRLSTYPKAKQTSPSHDSQSDASTPSPSDPFQIIEAAFDPPSPVGEFGIFHTPSRSGPSRLSSDSTTTPSNRSSSSDVWDTPLTPSLTYKSSIESFASFSTSQGGDVYLPSSGHPSSSYSWDQSSQTPSAGGSSYTPHVTPTAPHRVTSNPTLGSAARPKTIRPVQSMPALTEEVACTPSQWFDGNPVGESSSLAEQQSEDTLTGDFDWVFSDYGLGDSAPTDSSIFATYHSDGGGGSGPLKPLAEINYESQPPPSDLSWMPESSTQDVDPLMQYTDFSSIPSFTIDPMAVMAPHGMDEDEHRPSSAPGLNSSGGQGFGLLSVPAGGSMMKSLSSDGLVPSRRAPPSDLFSYAPQQLPVNPPAPQALFTTNPSPSYHPMGPSAYPRALPLTPMSTRRSMNQLQVQIQPPHYSTFVPAPLPTPPHSATFPLHSYRAPPQASMMQRAGTQPLPQRRRMSRGADPVASATTPPASLPAHLARAQAIVQMQEAKEQAERDSLRRQHAQKRVGMAEASVMQPSFGQSYQQPMIMGWEGPSTSLPIMPSAPLVTVHPPPAQYQTGPITSAPHRVHPPPYPGTQQQVGSRPIARLPSSPTKRKVSPQADPALLASPTRTTKPRSPSSKRKAVSSSGGGGFSWGETTFINFTSDDADKLLTGVAPSGSQSKRKREEETRGIEQVLDMAEDMDRGKRSRSDE